MLKRKRVQESLLLLIRSKYPQQQFFIYILCRYETFSESSEEELQKLPTKREIQNIQKSMELVDQYKNNTDIKTADMYKKILNVCNNNAEQKTKKSKAKFLLSERVRNYMEQFNCVNEKSKIPVFSL